MTVWTKAKLGTLTSKIGSGATPLGGDEVYRASGISFIRSLNVYDGGFRPKDLAWIDEAQARRLSNVVVEPGDVLLNITGASVARCCVVPSELLPARVNQHVCILRPQTRKLDSRFLHRLLTSRIYKDRLLSTGESGGATRQAITKAQLEEFEVEYPSSLAEQQRIAKILDAADALRAKRRGALAQLDTLTQAVFLEMFGDPGTILHRWPTGRLGTMVEFLTSGSRGWAEHYASTGDLFLRIQNVGHDELRLSDITYVNAPNTAEAKRTLVQPGDVLLSITADLGRTAVVPEGIGRAFINQHLSIIRTKSVLPRFLSAYFASAAGQAQVSGRNRQGVKAGLNFDDIRSFVLPLPPRARQQAFTASASAIEKLKTAHRASLAELDALFASLQHRAFRGEL